MDENEVIGPELETIDGVFVDEVLSSDEIPDIADPDEREYEEIEDTDEDKGL